MSTETLGLFDDPQHPVPAEARKLRDQGIAAAAVAEDDWWRSTADAAIRHLASTGHEWSTNDLRELVPESIRPRALASRISAAARDGLIEIVGTTRSDKPSSHGAWISVWRKAQTAPDGA